MEAWSLECPGRLLKPGSKTRLAGRQQAGLEAGKTGSHGTCWEPAHTDWQPEHCEMNSRYPGAQAAGPGHRETGAEAEPESEVSTQRLASAWLLTGDPGKPHK